MAALSSGLLFHLGIIFSILSGLSLLAGVVYLGYNYIKKHSGKTFSVDRPGSDYFLMRNEDESDQDEE